MQKLIILVAICFVGVLSMPYTLVEDDVGEEYYLVPVRMRRGVDIQKSGSGSRVTVGHGGNLANTDRHRLDGSAFASKPFRPSGPLTTGGRLDYSHKPSGSGANLGVQNTRHFGTDVSAQGNLNLYRGNGGRTTLDGNAGYNRHFGGPGGTGRPNYGAGLNFNHRF